ncbi:MAG: flagellar biosynthesis anti-sigma factor FlgM [Gemmatimonadetes bacterium]|nr:flagellar biosynthesis anti-sigma factor FlgM [Gemmatimonadota bacterium]
MRIENKTPEVTRPEAVRNAPSAPAHAGSESAPAAQAGRTDRIELSPEARALAARLDEPGAEELTPERIAQLRQRIQDGVYDSPELADAVAQRILESGDL